MPVINISNGIIIDISRERGSTLVTVTYSDGPRNRRNEQTVRLVVNSRTIILNANGMPVPAARLSVGMTINATISSAMTRSIPPQATAYFIRIVRRQPQDNITTGRILNINRENRSFTTASDQNSSTVIQFNVPENARIFDRMGRPIRFRELRLGMLVRVRHASFMTASIPPQTTAYEIHVL